VSGVWWEAAAAAARRGGGGAAAVASPMTCIMITARTTCGTSAVRKKGGVASN
jgi:hypothetical protein